MIPMVMPDSGEPVTISSGSAVTRRGRPGDITATGADREEGGTAPARNRDEGGLFDRQLRHRLHQRDEVDERREGLVQKVRIDPSWFLRARAGRWRLPAIWEVFEVRFKAHLANQVCLGSKGEARVDRTGGSDGCSTRTAAHPPLLVCAWRAAWPEAVGFLPTCRHQGGSRNRCVRRA